MQPTYVPKPENVPDDFVMPKILLEKPVVMPPVDLTKVPVQKKK